ncbi:hypothetical protein AB0I28_24040 [Phytomonospora sp. NPDC050363]|uniref:hypothetical protein n=1 Tax=Phytomonospora sp. NPDC050363 TaxID=3155642 RepID=UPI0033C0CA1E
MRLIPTNATVVHRFLLLGDPAHQYPIARTTGTLVAAELATDTWAGEKAVELLRAGDSEAGRLLIMPTGAMDGQEAESLGIAATWNGLGMSADLEDRLAEHLQGGRSAARRLSPLLMLRCHPTERGSRIEVLVAARFRAGGVVFVRVSRWEAKEAALSDVLPHCLELCRSLHPQVANDRREFENFHPQTEIETKIDLPGEVSIWALTSAIGTALEAGSFEGFIPDLGNELLRRSTRREICEIVAPPDEVGYIALRRPTGRMLKVKTFSQDGLRRREVFHPLSGVPTASLADVIGMEFPHLTVRELSSIDRTLYCINVESAITGHLYSVELDEVVELDRGRVLRQLEVEYDYSRVHEGLSSDSIEPELFRLTNLLEQHLKELGVTGERTYHSKLSFLRDCAADPGTGGSS